MYELLFSGEVSTGDVISEVEVATRLQVSRTPVRLAFQQLEAEGLIINDGDTGKKSLAAFGATDIWELYSVRSVLEGLAHRAAATKMGPQRLQELSDLLEQMHDGSRAGKAMLEADFRFHEVVCESGGMPRLVAILRRLWLQTFALVRQLDLGDIYPDGAEVERVHADHAAVLAALQSGDPEASEQAVIRHLQRARDALLAAAVGSPLPDSSVAQPH